MSLKTTELLSALNPIPAPIYKPIALERNAPLAPIPIGLLARYLVL